MIPPAPDSDRQAPRIGPRKFRGSGGGATMNGYVHRSPPPAAFWSLCRRGQRNSPRRAKPSAWNESLPKNRRAGERPAPTATQAKKSKIGQPARPPPKTGGGGPAPPPYDISGKIQQNRTPGAHCAPLRRLRQDTAKQGGPPGPPSFILPCRKTTSESPATARPR